MPLSNIIFQTSGSWDTSSVLHMNQQIYCMAIKLDLQSNRHLDEKSGGVKDGVDIESAIMLVPNSSEDIASIETLINQGSLDQAYNSCRELDIFPGEITILNHSKELRVVFNDPYLNTENIQVFLEGVDISQDFCSLFCDIDYIANNVTCHITLTTERHFLSFTNETVQIL